MTKKIFSLLLVICLISISALPATAQPDISMYSYLEGGAAPDQHPEDETTEPAATPSTTEDTTTPPESTETETDLTETEPAPIAAASAEAPAKRIGTFGIEPNRIDMFAAPSGNQPAKIVADNHVLMTRADGRFFVWGDNTYGQLGLGAGAPTKVYTPTENTFFADNGLKIKDIFVIEDVSFILCSNGELYGFGKGLNGRLGLGSTSNVNTPTLIPGSQNLRIEKLYGGKEFVLAATGNNEIYGWGRNNFGQVGNNTKVDVTAPTLIMSNADISNLEVGDDFAMLIKQDKSVFVWGNNAGGRYGFDTSVNKSASIVTAPVCVNPTTICTAHPSYTSFHCQMYSHEYPRFEHCAGTWALTEAGYQGTKGAATMNVAINLFSSPQKVVVSSGRNFTSLGTIASTWSPTGTSNGITNNIYNFISTANYTHNHNKSYSYVPDGHPLHSQCLPLSMSVTRGYTHTWQYVLPNAYQYFDTAHATDLQIGNKHGIVNINGLLYYGWGDNTLKQQGTSGNANGYMVPLTQINTYINQLNSGEGFASLQVAGDTNFIITGTGNVSVWGSNANGKAGIDSAASYIDTPTKINALDGKAVATAVAGRNSVHFITHTGDVYATGDNLYGQLGLGDDYADEIKVTSPILIETFKFSEAAVAPDAPDGIDTPDEVEAGTDFEIHWTNVGAEKYEIVRHFTPAASSVMTFSDPAPIEEVVYTGDQTTFTDTIHDEGTAYYSGRAVSFFGDYSAKATSTDILILPSSTSGDDGNNGNNDSGNNNNNNGGSGVDKEYLDYILEMFTKMTESQQQFVIEYLRNNGVSDELIAAILAASKKNNSGDVNVTVPGMDKDTAALIAAGMQESNGNSGQTGAPTTNVYNQPSDLSGLVELLGAYGMDAEQPEALSMDEQLNRTVNRALSVGMLKMLYPEYFKTPEPVPTVAPVSPEPVVYQAENSTTPQYLSLFFIIGLLLTMGGLILIRIIPKKE